MMLCKCGRPGHPKYGGKCEKCWALSQHKEFGGVSGEVFALNSSSIDPNSIPGFECIKPGQFWRGRSPKRI
jgi:hypothetical protein